jgi:hypothetical protein
VCDSAGRRTDGTPSNQLVRSATREKVSIRYPGSRSARSHCSLDPNFAHRVLMIIGNCSRSSGSYTPPARLSAAISSSHPGCAHRSTDLSVGSGKPRAVTDGLPTVSWEVSNVVLPLIRVIMSNRAGARSHAPLIGGESTPGEQTAVTVRQHKMASEPLHAMAWPTTIGFHPSVGRLRGRT